MGALIVLGAACLSSNFKTRFSSKFDTAICQREAAAMLWLKRSGLGESAFSRMIRNGCERMERRGGNAAEGDAASSLQIGFDASAQFKHIRLLLMAMSSNPLHV